MAQDEGQLLDFSFDVDCKRRPIQTDYFGLPDSHCA